MSRKQRSFFMSDDQYAAVQLQSDATGHSCSAVMRAMVEAALAFEETGELVDWKTFIRRAVRYARCKSCGETTQSDEPYALVRCEECA